VSVVWIQQPGIPNPVIMRLIKAEKFILSIPRWAKSLHPNQTSQLCLRCHY